MIGKQVSVQTPVAKVGFTAAAILATMVALAACSPAATTAPAASSEATAAPTLAPTTAATTAAATSESAPAAEQSSGVVKLNLNTATAEEFLTVPDVGNRMVHEFEEYRPYTSILQFRREIGKYVDEAQVAAYEEYVYVPVVPNEADADTLQQLPGVTPEIAEQLIAGRPYASNEAFVEALAALVTPEELAVGQTYLESE